MDEYTDNMLFRDIAIAVGREIYIASAVKEDERLALADPKTCLQAGELWAHAIFEFNTDWDKELEGNNSV